ncbi:MAG: peptidase E [Pedobacter sp.]|nr:MAG: peptidase E [Pedobacter sp.]
MKLLLTSAGISNQSIEKALVELLGKPINEAVALYVPTAIYAIMNGTNLSADVINGKLGDPFCQLGWKSIGILELTALPSLQKDVWSSNLKEADALLVGGGDCQYLCYWMQQSGLADLLPSLLEKTVYVGLSAGSMIMGSYGTTYGNHILPVTAVKSLNFLDFAIHPHLGYNSLPDNSFENLKKLSATLPYQSYAIDDQTAIKILDDQTEVISEGNWHIFHPS